jgi:protoporphyrinogen oxidase
MSRSRSFAIVGAGMLGMTLAHRLTRAGHRATLFESAPGVGGLASAWQIGDVTWDRHYHVTLLSDLYLRRLLRELDLEQDMRWNPVRTGFYADGRFYSLSSSLEFLRFPLLGMIDRVRLALTILRAAHIREADGLEGVLVTDWLRRWSGRRVLERLWLPLLRSKLGDSYRHVSAVFIWATIARLYAARRSGLKREQFGYVRGGYARVLERFRSVLEAEGVRIHLGRRVERVVREGTLLRVAAGGDPESFDAVVLSIPASQIAAACPQLEAAEKERLKSVRYQGIVCASVLSRRPLKGFYVTNILDSWVPFTGVIEMSALVDPEDLGGHSLVYLPKYVDPTDPLFELDDAVVREHFVAALRRMYQDFRDDDVLAFRVSRVRQVFALPTLRYSELKPPMHTSVPELYVVNSAQIVDGTLNVNETVRLAEQASEQLAAGAA